MDRCAVWLGEKEYDKRRHKMVEGYANMDMEKNGENQLDGT